MPGNTLKFLGSWSAASRRPHPQCFITHTEIWMAILMLYLPPLHLYRNSGSILVTLVATCCGFLFISLPVLLVELIIGSFSNGSLTRAYGYNRLAQVSLCINFLHQLQNLLAGTENAHKVLTYSLTFFIQNMNPHVSMWNCDNPWNTKACCNLLAMLNSSDANTKLKARCSTPLEEFFKHYGNILFNVLHVPNSSTYDGGSASLAIWILIGAFLLFICQLSLRDGIRCVTYLLTIPSTFLFALLIAHCYSQPLTSTKVGNLITRRDYSDEYVFTLFMPNLYHANQMMVAGGYLVVLHCCRKPHQNDEQLKKLFGKNLVLLAVCLIVYKCAICIARHGNIGVANLMRYRAAGLHIAHFDHDTYRDIFEDSKDWIYQTLFEYIESMYIIRNEFNFVSPLMILEGAALLHPVMIMLGFIGIRVAIYKATWELMFHSAGLGDLLSGPWQMLTRLSMPLTIMAIAVAADNELCRDMLFPKEPYGYAFCSLNVVAFLPTFLHAQLAQKMGRMGQSLFWRMMQFALRFKRRLTIIGLLVGVHHIGAQVYKNVFIAHFRGVLRGTKLSKTPKIDYFQQYDVGVFGANARRVFSFSGTAANWVFNDVLLALIGCISLFAAVLQSDRVIRFLQSNYGLLHVLWWKPFRCFKYCLEFFIAVMFEARQ